MYYGEFNDSDFDFDRQIGNSKPEVLYLRKYANVIAVSRAVRDRVKIPTTNWKLLTGKSVSK